MNAAGASPGTSTPWSEPVAVSTAPGSQFFPAVAVDQSTGNVAVGFHSTANDSTPRVEYVATVSGDGGRTFAPPQTLSLGATDVTKPQVDYNTFPFQETFRRLQLGLKQAIPSCAICL